MDLENHPPLKAESSFGFVTHYIHNLKGVLFEPQQFFSRLPVSGGLAVPLTFALVTHWIGSAINYFWSALIGDMGGHFYDRMVQFSSQYSSQYSSLSGSGGIDSPGRNNAQWNNMMGAAEKAINWIWGTSGILLDPFYTLAAVLFTSFLVFIGARIFANPDREGILKLPQGPTFESAVRIVAFGMGPAILSGVPYLGTFVAKFIYIPLVTIIGARELYRISNGRAVLIALFPDVLFWGILFMGALVLAAFFLKFASNFFM